jgi:hypothetical protein
VIQTHNNYTLGVFNGDTGTIVEIDGGSGLTVDFGDGRVVTYGTIDILDLDHAYGLTVHRAQGSEWPGVVVLASSSFGPILSRNLLYTALTRARQAVVVVGDERAIAEAVARTRDQERETGLPILLQAGVAKEAPSPTPPPCAGEGRTSGLSPSPAHGGGVGEGASSVDDPGLEEIVDNDDHSPPADPYDAAVYDPMPDDWPD